MQVVKTIMMIDDDRKENDILQEAILTSYPHVELLFAHDDDQVLRVL